MSLTKALRAARKNRFGLRIIISLYRRECCSLRLLSLFPMENVNKAKWEKRGRGDWRMYEIRINFGRVALRPLNHGAIFRDGKTTRRVARGGKRKEMKMKWNSGEVARGISRMRWKPKHGMIYASIPEFNQWAKPFKAALRPAETFSVFVLIKKVPAAQMCHLLWGCGADLLGWKIPRNFFY